MDEIMRCLQGTAEKVAVNSFHSLSMWLGMALNRTT